MNKSEIRRLIKARKLLLTDTEKRIAAENVFCQLEQTEAFIHAENILIYHSLPDELTTIEFIDRWSFRKRLYLPRVNGTDLEILPYDKSRLEAGAFNIKEPSGDCTADINVIDLIIVPAIAFDCHGNRVGRGKGFYDRLLSGCSILKIGIGYDFQLIEDIDAESHDVKVNMIITDRRQIMISH